MSDARNLTLAVKIKCIDATRKVKRYDDGIMIIVLFQRVSVWRVFAMLMLCCGAPAAVANCVELSGDSRQGGLLWGQVAPTALVTLDETSILVMPSGAFVLGLGRDAPKEQALSIVYAGDRCTQTVAVAQRQYNIQRVEGVPQKTVTPPNDVFERIARERALVRKAKAQRIERPELLEAVRRDFLGLQRAESAEFTAARDFIMALPVHPITVSMWRGPRGILLWLRVPE